jgi:hypothetical protein
MTPVRVDGIGLDEGLKQWRRTLRGQVLAEPARKNMAIRGKGLAAPSLCQCRQIMRAVTSAR